MASVGTGLAADVQLSAALDEDVPGAQHDGLHSVLQHQLP